VRALGGPHAPEEQAVVATVAHGEGAGVDTMVDHPGDRHLGRGPALGLGDPDEGHPVGHPAVDVDELFVEGSVDGGDHGQVGVALGVDRAEHGVVVDDVDVGLSDGVVGGHDVAQLGDGEAHPVALGLLQEPAKRHRAGRVTGGVEQDLVAGLMQATGQAVDRLFDPAVAVRWDRAPRGGDNGDSHGRD